MLEEAAALFEKAWNLSVFSHPSGTNIQMNWESLLAVDVAVGQFE